MSKIVIAVNSMISHADQISNVEKSEDEYYFLYNNKYKWSMREKDGNYFLYFYPGNETLDQLINTIDFNSIDLVIYSTQDLKTREAEESFRELYLILKEKFFEVDSALEDIIGGT